MSKSSFLAAAGTIGLMLAAASAQGGVGATGCDDLGGITETPMVDFQSQVQPILDDCTGCHGQNGFAGVDLRPGESFDNLVGVVSTTNPARLRVDPFEPDSSALLLAVNCDAPGGPGFQMGNVSLAERALIRDWIAQGALPEPAGTPQAIAVPVDSAGFLIAMLALLLLLAGIHFRRTA
ncbi:MAG: hypothetical protein U5L08_03545 [Xanthomonadales bacterium]|nr:hypothetical protein [Xanthomonadales bacterium]